MRVLSVIQELRLETQFLPACVLYDAEVIDQATLSTPSLVRTLISSLSLMAALQLPWIEPECKCQFKGASLCLHPSLIVAIPSLVPLQSIVLRTIITHNYT